MKTIIIFLALTLFIATFFNSNLIADEMLILVFLFGLLITITFSPLSTKLGIKVLRTNFYITLFILCTLLFQGCSPKDNPLNPDNDVVRTLLDTSINVSNGDATFELKDRVTITIPQGVVETGTKLIIKELDPNKMPKDDYFEFYESYDISLGNYKTFSKPITIKFNYDKSKVSAGIFKDKIGIAYYDETAKNWTIFKDVVNDSITQTLTFQTNHLTKLSRFGWMNKLGYTNYRESEHFIIYWIHRGVLSNTDYVSPFSSQNDDTDPDYIQDILRYMEMAYGNYKQTGLDFPNSKIEIRVQDCDEDDGYFTKFGVINIHSKMTNDNGVYTSLSQKLPHVCTHELFHFCQDYYYNFWTAGLIQGRWFLEATASTADRYALTSEYKPYEAESICSKGEIAELIHTSWDTWNSDPAWYQASSLFAYLCTYRSGTKFNLITFLKEAGEITDLSYYRTILDKSITASLGTKLGDEYSDFIRWIYEQNEIKLPVWPIPRNPISMNPYIEIQYIYKDLRFSKNEVKIPYLAMETIKIASAATGEDLVKVKIKCTEANDNIDIFAYSGRIKQDPILLGSLEKGDSMTVEVNSVNSWVDVIMVNKSLSGQDVVKLEFSLIEKPELKIDPPTITGTSKINYNWTANLTGGPKNIRYEWDFGDSKPKLIKTNDNKGTHSYDNSGNFTIQVMAFDNDVDTLVASGQAIANIEGTKLNFTKVKVFIDFNSTSYDYNWWFDAEKRWETTILSGPELCEHAGFSDADRAYFPGVQGRKYKGSFSGMTFTGSCTGGAITITLAGDVNAGKSYVQSFNCTFTGETDLKNFTIENSSVIGENIPQKTFNADYQAEYSASDLNVISDLIYRTKCKKSTDDSWQELKFNNSKMKSILIRFEMGD